MPNASRPHRFPRLRAILAPAVDNWPARVYLAAVAASLGVFLVVMYASSDPGFIGVWPTMTTAPLGIVALLVTPAWDSSLGWLSTPLFTMGTALAGLANAAVLGLITRKLVPRRSPNPA
ncbi:SCO4225 family membrane protein [Streptomyces uncialis]|uniref:SCO4225 family membrane protein n=1 Tax=Streptomyces uncialis TaxID=1048205 RepID=UPI0033E7BC4E